MNLFSGLNNLRDITLSPDYATICGYAHNDVENCFSEYLEGVNIEELKRWYNGYSFSGKPANCQTVCNPLVYNPYDILLFFQEGKQYRSYWFETGTGYLTIKKTEKIFANTVYTLSYPNLEVKNAFNGYLVSHFTDHRFQYSSRLYNALLKDQFDIFRSEIERLFAAVPYSIHGNLYNYEGFYVSVMYSFLAGLGLDLVAGDITNRGRADLTLKFPGNEKVYLIEFKVIDDDKTNSRKPMEQIREKRYFEKYIGAVGKIFMIGLEFSKKERNLVSFEWDEVHSKSTC